MAQIILITGGARSGKSRLALDLAEKCPEPRAFIATCPPLDEEMQQRIEAHQNAREKAGWDTIEETTNLADVLQKNTSYNVMLIDCITLWINNLMHRSSEKNRDLDESNIEKITIELLGAARKHPGTVIFVTNEVGMGIVPENALARRYRDLVGRCNQAIAAAADDVRLVTCGIDRKIK
ncbi:MAG: bifunctional adenosylcobinamide kinase/adenosylcobinamide-phosphate guanylyltransferase [Candidatus Brocadiia bacterium]